MGAKAFYAHDRSNSKGVAIILKRGLKASVSNFIPDPEGRFIILKIKLDEEFFTLINVYAPTQNEGSVQGDFMTRLNSAMQDIEITDLLIGGDFNIQIFSNSPPSTCPSRSPSNRATYLAHITDMLSQYDLSDVWSHRHPGSNKPTFHRGSQSSRLDYWFLPNHLLTSIADMSITPNPLSDHSLISVDLGNTQEKRGPGYWRFNNQLLQDPNS